MAQAQAIQVLGAALQGDPAAQAQAPGAIAAIAPLIVAAAQGDAASQAQAPGAIAALAPFIAPGNPALADAADALAPAAAAGNQAAIQALAPLVAPGLAAGNPGAVVAVNAAAAAAGNQAAIQALVAVGAGNPGAVVAVNAAAAVAGNQAAIAAIVPAINAAVGGNNPAALIPANRAVNASANAVVAAGGAAPRLGLLASLASGSSVAASAIGGAVSSTIQNLAAVTGRMLPVAQPAAAQPAVPALALLPQGAGAPMLVMGQPVAGNVQALPSAANAHQRPQVQNRNNFVMRGNPIRGPPIQDREHIVGQLAQNLIITPDIIREAIENEAIFLAAYQIRPDYPGYDVILTELVLLRLQILLGGIHLSLNASHFLDRADLPVQISVNDYERRLMILESQASGLIASAGPYANQLRLNMIVKFRRESLTEQLIATELNAMYERIKYGRHGQIINSYGPFMDGIRQAIVDMNANPDPHVAATQGNNFLTVTYPNLLALMPVTIHNQVIKIKLRQIEAVACLYAHYLTTRQANINLDYLTSNIQVFMQSDNRVEQLGVSRFRVDLAQAVGLNPYRYLFDRTIMDMGRFIYRFSNNAALGAFTLLSQLLHSHPTSQALNPAFIEQMMVAIEEQLGASNSAPGSLVFVGDPLIRDAAGQITGVSLGGAALEDDEIDLELSDQPLSYYIRIIVGNLVNDKTSLEQIEYLISYFNRLFVSCNRATPPQYIECIPEDDGTINNIENPYFHIEGIYNNAVELCSAQHAIHLEMGTEQYEKYLEMGTEKYEKYLANKAKEALTFKAVSQNSKNTTKNRSKQFKQKNTPTVINALRKKSVNNRPSMRNTVKKKMQLGISGATQFGTPGATQFGIQSYGGSRTRRGKRTRKNRKRTRRY